MGSLCTKGSDEEKRNEEQVNTNVAGRISRSSTVARDGRPSKEDHSRDISMVRVAGEGGITEEVTEKGGVLYEKKENTKSCRECGNTFSITNSSVKALVKLERHHCRSCGGVFCDKCTQHELQIPGSFDTYRCCPGCWRGETPGDILKEKMSHIIDLRGEGKEPSLKPSHAITLSRGEKYKNIPSTDVPSSGYLEFINKSSENMGGNNICCVKVLCGGGDTKFEVPRPSYISVPPGEVVNCAIPEDVSVIEVLVLFGNSSGGGAFIYDTRAPGITAEKVSQCAKVSHFPYVAAYKIICGGKNVFLKYKGEGTVDVRAGNNVGRIGLKAKVLGNKRTSQSDSLDYATNVSAVEKLFQY